MSVRELLDWETSSFMSLWVCRGLTVWQSDEEQLPLPRTQTAYFFIFRAHTCRSHRPSPSFLETQRSLHTEGSTHGLFTATRWHFKQNSSWSSLIHCDHFFFFNQFPTTTYIFLEQHLYFHHYGSSITFWLNNCLPDVELQYLVSGRQFHS